MQNIHHFYSSLLKVKNGGIILGFHSKLKWHLRVVMPKHDSMVNHFIRHHFTIQTSFFNAAHDYFSASLTSRMSRHVLLQRPCNVFFIFTEGIRLFYYMLHFHTSLKTVKWSNMQFALPITL